MPNRIQEPITIQTPRRPLANVALAMILGIVVARGLDVPLLLSLRFFVGTLLLYVACRFRPRVSNALLLLATASLGSARYTEWMARDRPSDVARHATVEPQLSRLRGSIHAEPTIAIRAARAGMPAEPWTRFLFDVHSIASTEDWIPSSGRVEVHAKGSLDRLRAGDAVEAFGWLSQPLPPPNPGQFDYADYLAGQGAHATLRSEDERAVRLLAESVDRRIIGARDRLRRWARSTFERGLSPTAAGLASTLILGYRTALPDEELDVYRTTGTMHLLVVSGTHLVLVSWMLWMLISLIVVNLRLRVLLILTFTMAYAFLSGGDPPVVRAAVIVAFWLGGLFLSRRPDPVNSLAAAAITLLALNPTTLFNVGAQLSFLAVATIVHFVPVINPQPERPYEERWWWRLYRWGSDVLVSGLVVSFVVGLVLSPLLIYSFHLVTPMGILLSAILLPIVSLILFGGIGLLLAAPVVASFLPLLAFPLQWMLLLMQWIVSTCDRLPLSHAYVPSAPAWWTIGFYAMLFLPLTLSRARTLGCGYLMSNVAWIGLGGLLLLWPNAPRGLEYHQLAVGHGNCGVLRFPDGRTVLYDCGSLTIPEVTKRVVAPWLWSQGVSVVDAVIVSHADFDHFNGLAELAQQFSIRKAFISPQTAHSSQADLAATLRALLDAGTTIELLWAGDQIRMGTTVIEVLQPSPSTEYATDNESSLVLLCSAAGYRLLLTGDLSHRGIEQLLAQPRPSIDILIAPHHGSRPSNPPELAAWARPTLVISTQQRSRGQDGLAPYRELGATVLRTDDDGAISCRWLDDALEVQTYLSHKRFYLRP
jgi:competence protein ComEC